MVFEEYEYVKVCGVKIYVEVVGFGMLGDVYYMILLSEDGFGGVLVMEVVMCDVGVIGEQIGYVNVYGIFIFVGDVVEVKGIKCVLGEVGIK